MRRLPAAFAILALCGVPVRAQDAPSKPPYVAFRAPKALSNSDWQALADELSSSGAILVEDRTLRREGILVFTKPGDPALTEKLRLIEPNLLAVPVREFRGALSVSSGYFYLKFQDDIGVEEARKRLASAGFRIINPDPKPGVFLVVAASRLPSERDKELARLKLLPGIRYAAPDDIPLPPSAQPAKAFK